MNAHFKHYNNCLLCPRYCGVNRIREDGAGQSGFCGETDQLRVAYVGPHFGEEPPITGENGSGTVFFTGCSLRCSFCQNYQISHKGLGVEISADELLEKIKGMIRNRHVHNVNFVTPDHFFPHVFRLVSLLRKEGFDLPVLFNLSGYQDTEMLKMAENYTDIYLPDFKYSDASLAVKLSKCRDYSEVALKAIGEMVKQKGFFDTILKGSAIAKKGVLVRHLILPGNVGNSTSALTSLFVEFGKDLPLSLMSQYQPIAQQKDKVLNRPLAHEEFDRVYAHAMELGFENFFVQFPEKGSRPKTARSPFFPDFQQAEPFSSP